MEINNVEKEGKKMEFDLEESNTAVANAIRRTLMREVPMLAVKEIDFFENTSSMPDEFIAHRIGMNPLNTPKTLEDSDKTIILTLHVKGPGDIYASNLESEDPEVEPIYPETPIIKLEEGKEIELEAKAEIGTGKEHARHKSCFTTYTTEEKGSGKFHFKIESYVERTPEELLGESLQIIKDKANKLKQEVKEE